MVFKENSALYANEIERRQGEVILYINYMSAPFVPSISDNAPDMARVVNALVENSEVSRVVFVQQRNYNYPSSQVLLLSEIARIYSYLTRENNILSIQKLKLLGNVSEIQRDLNYLLGFLVQDPLFCFVELKRRIAQLNEQLQSGEVINRSGLSSYIHSLEKFHGLLEESALVKRAADKLSKFSGNVRGIYKDVFFPDVLPNFTFTRLVAHFPADAELVDQYEIGNEERATVSIIKIKDDLRYLYHLSPPEYSLSEEHHLLLNLARGVLLEHRPKAEEFTDPEKTRYVFFNVAKDLLGDLAKSKSIELTYSQLEGLARVLVRYTIGYGLIEILLMDSKLQDIVLNAPIAQNPIFVRHGEHDECVTNILPSYEDADSWAAKLRLQSGRPLDESNPVLDSELVFGGVRARIAAIKEPLSSSGLAYAIRRHRDQPWTLPLFIHGKMINSFAAGLLSFIVAGSRTLLVAGTRSSGKTSLLGGLMLEILPKYRTIVIEDTQELPISAMRKLGYDILGMKVRSALVEGSNEIEAAEGIRTSLRLGDSALIVGEVRSSEAKALYEAMRVGALANVVAGTIHGDSPYGVFDRVVNDLGVPPTSFKATDIIIVANPVKTSDGLHSMRKVVQVTEVRKHWTKDPLEEGGFVDLLKYNVDTEELEPTPELINGDSEIIKSIAGNVKGWAGNWDAVYDNIILRGLIKQEIVNQALRTGKLDIMEAKFNVQAMNAFHQISDEVRKEKGIPLQEFVFPKWKKWLLGKIN